MTPQTLYSFRPWGDAFLNRHGCIWRFISSLSRVCRQEEQVRDQHSRSEALGCTCVRFSLSVRCNSRIPHVCAAATCERRFWSSSCTGISSHPSEFAGELGGSTGPQMPDCSVGMKKVSRLNEQNKFHVSPHYSTAASCNNYICKHSI